MHVTTHDHEILEDELHFFCTSLSSLWLVLGPNILVLCFILHVLSKLRGRKKKGNSGHTVQSRFDRQKELKKWLRNEVLEQHEAEAEVRL